MRSDLWVIWIAITVAVGTVSGSLGSLYFPSQDRLDAEYDAGYADGLAKARHHEPTTPIQPPGVARSANPSRETADLEASARKGAGAGLSGRDDELPRWDDTAENLGRLGARYYEPLGPILAVQTDTGTFATSPVYDQLAAEQAARMLPGPRSEASAEAGTGAGSNPAGPGKAGPGSEPFGVTGPVLPDPWELLAADLDDDPDISEWSAKADAARCTEIVRELRQLARTLEAT